MRITFVLPHAGLAGGIRVVAIYADRLARRGHDVCVVSTPCRVPSVGQKLKSLLKGRGWPKAEQGGPSHFDGLDVSHRVLERFRPVVDTDVPDADVVVATWWETAEWVASLSASKGAKVHFLQGDDRVGLKYNPNLIPRVERTWRLPFEKVAVSRWVSDQVRSVIGQFPVELVPNGVDTEQFCVPPRGKQPLPTIGLMYSPVAFKGCDVSLAAIAGVRKLIPALRVVAFGSQQPCEGLEMPQGAEYHHRPPQASIGAIYAKCDAWLFGSRCEGFGLPILEAMACRTPVIATPAGAAPELLAGGGGILVKPEDPQSMADAIMHVAQMTDRQWQGMSDAAYATAMRYSWDDATSLFEKALERAVERAGRGETA